MFIICILGTVCRKHKSKDDEYQREEYGREQGQQQFQLKITQTFSFCDIKYCTLFFPYESKAGRVIGKVDVFYHTLRNSYLLRGGRP